jgi:large subunit ribosomal protein L4e
VRARGHLFSGSIPVVFEDGFEDLIRTTEVISALTAAGVYSDIERSKQSRKVRAGRGKMRGRRYKQRKSILIVTSGKPLRAAKNLAGVDVVTFDQLNTEMLAPGTLPGRLTVFTERALMNLGGQ